MPYSCQCPLIFNISYLYDPNVSSGLSFYRLISTSGTLYLSSLLIFSLLVQEHVVHIVVKLLSPPIPPDSSASGVGNYLIGHMSVLSAILFGVSCVDIVHILSLYGMVSKTFLGEIHFSTVANLLICNSFLF